MRDSQILGWVAIVISIVALIFSWTAFNRAGEDLEDIVQREVQEAIDAMQTPEVNDNDTGTINES